MRRILAALFAVTLASTAAAEMTSVSAPEAHDAAEAGEMLLIDVRTPEEWAQTGAPEGAELLDMRDPAFLTRLETLTGGDPNRRIALICATGGRSGFVMAELQKRGYANVVNVAEGMHGSQAGPGWLKRGLPTVAP